MFFFIDFLKPEKWNDLLEWSQGGKFENYTSSSTSQNIGTFHWHQIFCAYFFTCQRSSLLSFKIHLSLEFEWNLHEISSGSFFFPFLDLCLPGGVYVQHPRFYSWHAIRCGIFFFTFFPSHILHFCNNWFDKIRMV